MPDRNINLLQSVSPAHGARSSRTALLHRHGQWLRCAWGAWEHVSADAVGFSAARLNVLREWLKTQPTTAMMAVYKGKVVFEYGDTALATNVASIRKSVLDILYAAELGNLPDGLNDATVVKLGLEDKVPFVQHEEMANFEQLLASRSGIYIPNGDSDQDNVVPKRGSEYPGVHLSTTTGISTLLVRCLKS